MTAHRRLFAPAPLLAPLAALVFGGCTAGPDFRTPAAPATDHYTAASLPAATPSTPGAGGAAQHFLPGAAVPSRWWTLFGSDALDHLVDDAFAGSPTVAAAQATLKQSQEELVAVKAVVYPWLDGDASAERQKISGAEYGGPPSIFNLYGATVNLTYGIDLFGGVHRTTEAQQAAVDYQRFELQATYQTLAANVVTTTVAAASLRDQVAATADIVADLQRQLDVTKQQLKLGGAAYSDVLDARSNLAAQQAALPGLKNQLDQTQHRLAVYLGKLPADFAGTKLKLSDLKLPTELPLSVPSELVRQRPDVRAAEEQLHQASAKIGIATINMLPQLSITGSFGDQSVTPGDLLTSGIWSFGANLAQPIFHGGELRAKRREAVDAYDAAAAQYRGTVLHSFQEVADALRALENDAGTLDAQYQSSNAAAESLHITERQYALGAVGFLKLLNAQRQFQQARIGYLQALASRYADTAALFQALGGGTLNTPAVATAAVAPQATPAAH